MRRSPRRCTSTLELSAKLTQLGLQVIVLLTMLLGLGVALDPGVEAVSGHAQAPGNIGDRRAFLGRWPVRRYHPPAHRLGRHHVSPKPGPGASVNA